MELIVSVTKSPAMAKSSSDTRTNTLVNQEQDNTVKEKSGSSNSLQPYNNNIENNMKVIDKKDFKNMEIIELPIAVQIDESQIILCAIESPNKSLHNILTHRLEEKTKSTGAIKEEENMREEDQISKMQIYPQ